MGSVVADVSGPQVAISHASGLRVSIAEVAVRHSVDVDQRVSVRTPLRSMETWLLLESVPPFSKVSNSMATLIGEAELELRAERVAAAERYRRGVIDGATLPEQRGRHPQDGPVRGGSGSRVAQQRQAGSSSVIGV